jgi:predicted component of type VI protein secretion system
MPRIIMISPEFAKQSCELCGGVFALGRDRRNHIVVPHESVSARHCELLVYGREVIVRDLGSRNGTFVQGIQVAVQKGVKHGQMLRFGTVAARLELEHPGNEDDADSSTAMNHYRAFISSPAAAAGLSAFCPVHFMPTQAIHPRPTTVKFASQGLEVSAARSCDETLDVSKAGPASWERLWLAGLAAGITSLALIIHWLCF